MDESNLLAAAGWGLVAGSALLIGAALGLYVRMSRRTVAWIMAFGSGVLISAIAFDVMEEAFATAGFRPAAIGFLLGAIVFTIGSLALKRYGGGDRKRSSGAEKADRNAKVVVLGTFIDGIPESIAIGLSLLDPSGVAFTTVAAIFLSNIPEALSSSAGMKRAGHSAGYVFTLWSGIGLVTALASVAGYKLGAHLTPEFVAATQGIAGGALIAMIADTMIPEAFHDSQEATGLSAAFGFLVGFFLSHGIG